MLDRNHGEKFKLKMAGFFIAFAFAIFYAIYLVNGVFFERNQYWITSEECMFFSKKTTNLLYFRAAFDIPAPDVRVFIKVIAKTHAYIYCNGNLIKTIEGNPVLGTIFDITDKVKQGSNLLALKVENRELKNNSFAKVNVELYMIDKSGSTKKLIKKTAWKVLNKYPFVMNMKMWNQDEYPDYFWNTPSISPADKKWGYYSSFPLSLYSTPLSGETISVSGISGRVKIYNNFILPDKTEDIFVRLLAPDLSALTINGNEIINFKGLKETIGAFSIKQFVRKGDNRLELIFLGQNSVSFFFDLLFVDKSGACIGNFISEKKSWQISDLGGISSISKSLDKGYPLEIKKISISFKTWCSELLVKILGVLCVLLIVFLDLYFFRKSCKKMQSSHSKNIIRVYYIYLLPLVLLIALTIISRDDRVNNSLLYSNFFLCFFPLLVLVQRVLSFKKRIQK